MRQNRIFHAVLLLPLLTLAGCELVGDILEVGFWAGVIIILLIVGVIWWLVRMFGRRGGP